MSVPQVIKVARDVDLIDDELHESILVASIEQMTRENFQRLADDEDEEDFDSVVASFTCDSCGVQCSPANPIYTNAKYDGMDVCTYCMTKAWEMEIRPLAGWNPGPIYSLKAIACPRDMRESARRRQTRMH